LRCWLLHSESRRSWKTRLYAAHRIQMTSRLAQAFSTSYVRMIAVAHTFVGSVFVPMKPHEPSRCSSCAMGQLVLLSSRHSPMSRLPSTKLRLDLFYHSDFDQSSLGPTTGYMLACSSSLSRRCGISHDPSRSPCYIPASSGSSSSCSCIATILTSF